MVLRLGAEGIEVSSMQEKLKIPVTGRFDNDTLKAVLEFQKNNNLVADGVVGQNTLDTLLKYSQKYPRGQNPTFIHIDESPFTDVEIYGEININKLVGLVPQSIIMELPMVLETFNITKNLELAHLLAQCAHESKNFTVVYENLNYTTDGLMAVFKDYFHDSIKASAFAHNPEKIANHVYANKNGNGNEESGDGWKYRGRGYIELTGKYFYDLFGEYLKVDIINKPDLVANTYPLSSAAYFFHKNNIFELCKDSSLDTIVKITRKVNVALLGLDQRANYFDKIYSVLCKQ